MSNVAMISRDYDVQIAAPRYLARDIISYVCRKYEVTRTDIESERRGHLLVIARQEAMFKIRSHTLLSMPAIGRLFGGRDHTTVIHACRTHTKRLNDNYKLLKPDAHGWLDALEYIPVLIPNIYRQQKPSTEAV